MRRIPSIRYPGHGINLGFQDAQVAGHSFCATSPAHIDCGDLALLQALTSGRARKKW
jgi:hypothetical protein